MRVAPGRGGEQLDGLGLGGPAHQFLDADGALRAPTPTIKERQLDPLAPHWSPGALIWNPAPIPLQYFPESHPLNLFSLLAAKTRARGNPRESRHTEIELIVGDCATGIVPIANQSL